MRRSPQRRDQLNPVRMYRPMKGPVHDTAVGQAPGRPERHAVRTAARGSGLRGPVRGVVAANRSRHRAGFLIGNASPSVPRGLYLRAEPDHASYVTFCLGTRHRGVWTYPDLCSPDTPDARRILKRVAMRHENGCLTVTGDTHRALDSTFLGPIRPGEIRGWWVPWITRGQ